MKDNSTKETDPKMKRSHFPTHSAFYDKFIPIILIVMAIMTAVFILVAAGILLGFVPFR